MTTALICVLAATVQIEVLVANAGGVWLGARQIVFPAARALTTGHRV